MRLLICFPNYVFAYRLTASATWLNWRLGNASTQLFERRPSFWQHSTLLRFWSASSLDMQSGYSQTRKGIKRWRKRPGSWSHSKRTCLRTTPTSWGSLRSMDEVNTFSPIVLHHANCFRASQVERFDDQGGQIYDQAWDIKRRMPG